jgi:hypothetical protein
VAEVAVVAHARKSFGGGLPELRRILALEGVTDPLWHEVKKSRRAPEYARRGPRTCSRRPASEKLCVKVRPGSVTVCVPPGRRG